MVTFKLIEEGIRYIVYWYFPEGNEENGHGVIVIDKEKKTIDISKLAPDDFSHEVFADEQNEMRESINRMRKEEHENELTEDEWPSATKSFTTTFFADHAISKICDAYNDGIVLKEGMSAWY